MATVITNLLSAIPFIGQDIVPFIWGGFSVSNPTIQRFFALHYLLPFILAALVVLHFIALHTNGSSNPIGITGNIDRISMHPYFIFKDLITVFVFLFVFCLFVFFSPNTLGQSVWPLINIFYIYLLQHRAICWKCFNYNKTNIISDLFFIIKFYANPLLVKYYYNKYNQQITNIYKYIPKEGLYLITRGNYILVGISETTRTQNLIKLTPGDGLRSIPGVNIHLYNFFINFYLLFLNLFTYLGSSKENNISEIEHSSFPGDNIVNYNTHNNNINNKFNQWLAGLIDGDGCFGITQKKYTNCEITVGIEDEKMLRQIQNKYGGSIKLRSGSNSIRYRLQNRPQMINLINAVNGNIRHSKRLVQLAKVCNLLEIDLISPIPLNKDNSWLSGFFDADGTINYYYYNNNRPQLFISVTNKYLGDIQPFKDILGGEIYFDKSQNGYYKWVITNETNHNIFIEYIKNNPSRSFKGNRIFLIKKYYKLYNIKAYLNNESLLYKNWSNFEKKWKSYSYKFF